MNLWTANLTQLMAAFRGEPRKRRRKSSSSDISFVALEDRSLLAAIVPNATTGIVDVYATPGNDLLTITDNPGLGTFTISLSVAVPYAPVNPVTLNYSDYSLVNGWGGDGDDTMDNTSFISSNLVGHAGNDTLRGGYMDDTIYGGTGDDTLVGRAGDDVMAGQGGWTWAWGGNGDDTFYGSPQPDVFYGGNDDDLAYGGDGNDQLYGEAGADSLWGGNHDDQVEGNDGDDFLYGQGGNDVLQGHAGHDKMWAHAGEDSLYGSSGNDGMYGGDGNDLLIGGNGDDDVRGDGGHDVLWGGDGHDFMMGGTGNDVMSGEAGNDNLQGGAGADSLNGGGQNLDAYSHGETDLTRVVYLNFDGAFISHAELEAWDNDWNDAIADADYFDAEEDGVTIDAFMDQFTDADRELLIQNMMVNLLQDLDEWGINVQRHMGTAVANQGTTTVFLGESDLTNGYHIACDLDAGNNNQTDIAFVGNEYVWTNPAPTGYGLTINDAALALSDVLLHEIGHTYGLEHVDSGTDNESMGLRYSNSNQLAWVVDTEFRDEEYDLLHEPGTQNAWQYMNSIF